MDDAHRLLRPLRLHHVEDLPAGPQRSSLNVISTAPFSPAGQMRNRSRNANAGRGLSGSAGTCSSIRDPHSACLFVFHILSGTANFGKDFLPRENPPGFSSSSEPFLALLDSSRLLELSVRLASRDRLHAGAARLAVAELRFQLSLRGRALGSRIFTRSATSAATGRPPRNNTRFVRVRRDARARRQDADQVHRLHRTHR